MVRKEGFTLLEIMIALAIIGLSLTVVIHTVNFQSGVLFDNARTTEMIQLAKEKLVELESRPVSSRGSIGASDYRYDNRVAPGENEDFLHIRTIIRNNGREVELERVIRKEGEEN